MTRRRRLSDLVANSISLKMEKIRRGAVSPAHADIAVENDDEILFLRELEREIKEGEREDVLEHHTVKQHLTEACEISLDQGSIAAMDHFDARPAW